VNEGLRENTSTLKFVQIDSIRSKVATEIDCQKLSEGMAESEFLDLLGPNKSERFLFLFQPMAMQGPVFLLGTTLITYIC
jgi:hypothetical protein